MYCAMHKKWLYFAIPVIERWLIPLATPWLGNAINDNV